MCRPSSHPPHGVISVYTRDIRSYSKHHLPRYACVTVATATNRCLNDQFTVCVLPTDCQLISGNIYYDLRVKVGVGDVVTSDIPLQSSIMFPHIVHIYTHCACSYYHCW